MTPMKTSPRLHPSALPRLHRSASNREIAGVCGELTETLEVDPILVRLGFVLAALWGGLGILLYVVLALILPIESVREPRVVDKCAVDRMRTITGLLLVGLGVLLLAGTMGWLP